MPCTLCGSDNHNRAQCPWKDQTLTKIILATMAALVLSGCAGLNVSWVATASYNTPATTSAILTPGK